MKLQISVDPVDDACIDISHLKKGGHLWVSDAYVNPDHGRHPPAAALSNNHGHPWTDMQEHRIRIGREDPADMVNQHTHLASAGVLTVVRGFWQL